MDKITIAGILFRHGEDDYSYWEGFHLTEEEEEIIANILFKHDTEGCSIRGDYESIIKEDK
jgi:hypothetical protein